MGVDWIPCRIDVGISLDELREHVRREALHFQTGYSNSSIVDPAICFSEDERIKIREQYLQYGPLHEKLLFKRASHRVSVITSEVLFPIEWRINAQRTILPMELDDQCNTWQNYLDEVRNGRHRSFLRRLWIYDYLRELANVDLENLKTMIKRSEESTGSWSTHSDLLICRNEIAAEAVLACPDAPTWLIESEDLDPMVAQVEFSKVSRLVARWNATVKRGNYKLPSPKSILDFEQWLAMRLKNDWFGSFLTWLEPWRKGRYGLYRDCE